MDNVSQFSSVIGDIYDAALDSTLWPDALQKIAGFVGGPAAALYAKDTIRKTGIAFHVSGIEPSFTQSYFEKYVNLDPFTTARFFFPVGQVISTQDVMPHEEFFKTAFFKEWASPQGWVDFVSVALDKSSATYAECGIFWHERGGTVGDVAREKMAQLVPHVRRAVHIGNVIDLHKVEAAALADVLDGLASAVLMVDAEGRIVHANASGHGLLDSGQVLRRSDGKLLTPDANAHHALRRIFSAAADGDLKMGNEGIAVPLGADAGGRYVAHILPLTAGARKKAGIEYSATAAVFVRKAGADLPHPVDALADAFKFTPAELRVLMMIVNIGGVPEVAPALGISETTVKTHLRRIFAKTETRRQADLVKLVASYMSPLE